MIVASEERHMALDVPWRHCCDWRMSFHVRFLSLAAAGVDGRVIQYPGTAPS